jgi:hypothetical protein
LICVSEDFDPAMVMFRLNEPDWSETGIRIARPDHTARKHRLDAFAQNQSL